MKLRTNANDDNLSPYHKQNDDDPNDDDWDEKS